MTNPVERARREKFEAYCISDEGGYCAEHLERDAEGNYTIVWEYWQMWNAALDSVVVDLPKKYDLGGLACDAHDRCTAMCRDAIHAAGVKTNER